jgi:hypothetical protein
MKCKANIKFLTITCILCFSLTIIGQERDWEKYLQQDVENVNPTYMPVVGAGVGYLSFIGDVRNNTSNPLMGSPALKINVHAFFDPNKHYKFNFYVLSTLLSKNGLVVNQRDYLKPENNYSFKSDMTIIGINFHYDFDHFIKKTSFVRPFVSIGGEMVSFSSKADTTWFDDKSKKHLPIYYWADGTIRDNPQADERQSKIVKPDGAYLKDLSSNNSIKFSQNMPAIPIEAGLDFKITERTNIRLAYALHYTFTDYIDGITSVASKSFANKIKGNSVNDMFGYTYFSLHFDLFSDPKMLRLNKLFAMLDDDDVASLFGDEDNDGIPDVIDRCPHTPKGVLVDTVGCPFDADGDGVPDYMDKQPGSSVGAIVDIDGVEIQDGVVWENLNTEALPRVQVEMVISAMNNLANGTGRRFGKVEIPPKFKSLDLDGDGYISFDEVLKAIDAFFDFDSDLTTQDIYELNDFFFSQ